MANKKIQLKSLTGDLLYPIIDRDNFTRIDNGDITENTLVTLGEVRAVIAASAHLTRKIVTDLQSVTDPSPTVIYMVPMGTTAEYQNIYEEYLYVVADQPATITSVVFEGKAPRDASLDTMVGSTAYYAWKAATGVFYTKTETPSAGANLFTIVNGIASQEAAGVETYQEQYANFELLGTTQVDISGKQDKLTVGDNIIITGSTISAVDTTYAAGEGLDLTGTEFSLEVASADNLGGVKVGTNINVAADGTISVADASSTVKGVVTLSGVTLGDSETTAATEKAVKKYISDALSGAGGIDIVIPDASTTSKGVVTVGININVNSGTISVADAAADTKGVVKISGATLGTSATVAATEKVVSDELAKKQDTLTAGNFINITGNTITTTYSAGTNIEITDGGVINATEYINGPGIGFNDSNNAFTLEIATVSSLGGVVVGDNISVDALGVISVADAATDTKGVVKISGNTLGTGADVAATEAAVQNAIQSAIAGFITFEEIV